MATYLNTNGSSETFDLTERYIYGSSRVGVYKEPVSMLAPPTTLAFTFLRSGYRQYELSNHLGNVTTTITAQKVPLYSGTTITGFAPQIVKSFDYSPFGVTRLDFDVTARLGGAFAVDDGVRYGFGGHERDDEVKGSGNWYTFGDYGYDPRIVQRPSPDPKWRNYPGQSPYATFNGNPILYSDPSGESGEVSINKESKTITVTSLMVFYGSEASPELAKSTAADVQSKWNEAAAKVSIDGVEYSVNFVVTGEHKPSLTPDEVAKNTDIKNNYIRVEEGNAQGISYMDDAGSNTGYYLNKNIKNDGSTTEGHDMGHGYGLPHPDDMDIRGEGQPGIMYPRGTLVDPEYQYNPEAKAGEKGGTVNPANRKVTQQDVDNLGLGKLKFNKSGKANLGKLTNKYHNDETPAKKP